MLAELNDDLNTPRALALAWEVLKSGLPGEVQKATLGWLDEVLGLGLDAWRPEAHACRMRCVKLVEARQQARRKTLGRCGCLAGKDRGGGVHACAIRRRAGGGARWPAERHAVCTRAHRTVQMQHANMPHQLNGRST
jgi:hypothetical protein